MIRRHAFNAVFILSGAETMLRDVLKLATRDSVDGSFRCKPHEPFLEF